MYKLLIVLAIQFCLPWVAQLLDWQFRGSISLPFHLEIKTLFINAICVACFAGLLRPHSIWMIWMSLIFGLLMIYLLFWEDLYHRKYVDYNHPEVPIHTQIAFFWYAAIFSCVVSMFFSRKLQLSYFTDTILPPTCTLELQFSLRDLFFATVLLALSMVALPWLKNTAHYSYYEIIQLLVTTALVYNLIWYRWHWGRVAIVVSVVSLVLWFSYPDLSQFDVGLLEQAIFVCEYLLIAIVSLLLYRWAGFRIVPRRQMPITEAAEAL